MKIVILDGYSANPGDLSWKELEKMGELTVYERTKASETVARAADAEIVLTNKVVINREVMEQLPHLKYIGVLATGYNVVDVEAACERGIVVTNVPAYSTDSVAQMVFAHLLTVTNRTDIGQSVARIAIAFGMKVKAFSTKSASALRMLGIEKATLEELLSTSDVLSLHCPLTDSTRHLMNHDTLRQMKSSAILINTGRGPLVDDQAVAEALAEGRLAAFCADVLTDEPPKADNPLLSQPHAFITPHIAWASTEARVRLLQVAIGNVRAFLNGSPVNVVN